MKTCPLQLYAQKSNNNNKSNKNLQKVINQSICLEKDCNWFHKQKKKCLLVESPYKLSYIKKTMQCI